MTLGDKAGVDWLEIWKKEGGVVEGMRLSQNDMTERETETDRKSQIQMETDRRRSGRGRLNGENKSWII